LNRVRKWRYSACGVEASRIDVVDDGLGIFRDRLVLVTSGQAVRLVAGLDEPPS